ncbi:MAG: aminomethyl-transferring glycine dehydrogenase [Pseudobdellovibrio sp.]
MSLDLNTNLSSLQTNNEFTKRHIGPSESDQKAMLKELGFNNFEELITKIVPKSIYSNSKINVGDGISEFNILNKLKGIVSENKIYTSLIGMGFHDTITPSPILRNVFENPVWYTAYTPYQPEISQGRLESLLNFQTMISDLTGMEISNASLLDEGTAAAEALVMAHSLSKKKDVNAFVVHPCVHKHVIEVLKTRSEPLGLEMIIADPSTHDLNKEIFAAIFQYPTTEGTIEDYKSISDKLHAHGAYVIASVDLLALTLLTPPGEWGADMVVGNSQRFGVPLGFGGPHAAFLATKDAFKRSLPGRLVGVSVDSHGKKALRLTLQTREQHIRREKATSNICTAQVLLANMAAMYGVYHGPKGLSQIALRIHKLTHLAVAGLEKLGFKAVSQNYFDTVKFVTPKAQEIIQHAEKLEINLCKYSDGVGFSFNETTDISVVEKVLMAFNLGQKISFNLSDLESSLKNTWPQEFVRKSSFMTHPTFNSYHSETELMRYIYQLQNKDVTLTHSMIPLGSCTMKLNAATELIPVSWPEINKMHPFAPSTQTKGYQNLIKDLEQKLCAITGFAAVSVQPNSGAQGEYAGLLTIREYFKAQKQSHRNICLIPSSAHGTNPASAVMAGFKVVVTACDENGNVDLTDLKAKAEQHKDNLAALMITYPSTHGVFEEAMTEICQIIHTNGGQVYMDGANLNALVGVAQPGKFGPDVSHMNLHKTFAIPHGGGGPGVGPIGVAAHLAPYLPQHSLVAEAGPNTGISTTTSAPWGSASILPISWSYITMMGAEGLRQATYVSILNANYIAKKLAPHYPIVYKGKEGLVAHECIIDIRPLKKEKEIDVTDIAKRLMDYGFHAPTMSWPVIGTLMIEPTESESKRELDRFCEAMIQIRKEADTCPDVVRNAPHTAETLLAAEWNHSYSREVAAYPVSWVKTNKYWPPVGRVDNAYGDKNIVCSCPPLDSYT